MPKFGQSSFKQLATAHPDLQVLFYEVIKHIDCQVLEGFRNQADQEAAVRKGNSKVHWPNGKHNHSPSYAVDVAPYPVDWKNTQRFFWFSGVVMGISELLFVSGKMKHKIRYGGDWNRNYNIMDETGLRDLVHFELIV